MASWAPCSICLPRFSSWLLPPVATETVGMIGPEEADLDGLHVFRFRDRPARPGVFHLQEEVLLERLDVAVGRHVVRGVGVAVIELQRQLGTLVGVERVDFVEHLLGVGVDLDGGRQAARLVVGGSASGQAAPDQRRAKRYDMRDSEQCVDRGVCLDLGVTQTADCERGRQRDEVAARRAATDVPALHSWLPRRPQLSPLPASHAGFDFRPA